MGCCASKSASDKAASEQDEEFDRKNREDAEKESSKIKLLLLGAGESGKSTVFKQFRIIHGKGFTAEDRQRLLPVIHNNVLTAIKALINATRELGTPLQTEEGKAAAAAIAGLADDGSVVVDDTIAGWVEAVWADAGVKDAYSQRNKLQLNDSAAYFLDKVRDLAKPGYEPTVEDVLKSRVRTSGIVEEEYTVDGAPLCIYDVGGQRNERRKWIHCFDDVTAIIFVAAISEYDQVMYEDSCTNRLVDALKLFEDVCNSRHFESTPIILFLNKRDLFAEKIKRVDLRQPNPDPFGSEREPVLFADYQGGCDYDSAVRYVVGQFLSRSRNPKKEIFWRVTCATDTDNVAAVFNSVKEIILKQNLITSGFMA